MSENIKTIAVDELKQFLVYIPKKKLIKKAEFGNMFALLKHYYLNCKKFLISNQDRDIVDIINKIFLFFIIF